MNGTVTVDSRKLRIVEGLTDYVSTDTDSNEEYIRREKEVGDLSSMKSVRISYQRTL